MMVPLQVTIVPVFLVLKSMGLTDTLLGLIIPAFPTAFGTFLMRQYFLGMPKDLGEAAMLDGAGPWRIFRSVYAPLAAPGLAIVGVLAFNYHWNEFFRPLILETSSRELHAAAGPGLPAGQPRHRLDLGGPRRGRALDDPRRSSCSSSASALCARASPPQESTVEP